MKSLSAIIFLLLASAASANVVRIESTHNTYNYWPSLLEGDVHWAEQTLSEYLTKTAGCPLVKLNLNITQEPGFLRSSKGSYDLELLLGDCKSNTSTFQFKLDTTCKNGYVTLYTRFDNGLSSEERTFEKVGGDDSCGD